MKKKLLLIVWTLTIFTSACIAQTSNSRDNYTGSWISNASWLEGTAPDVADIVRDINIRGYITRDGSLTFAANNNTKAITIYDTLIVTGNMHFANDAQDLIVGPEAVLIVLGNFSATNKISLSNGGIFVVLGDMSLSPSIQDTYEGSGELFVLGTISGNTAATTANDNSGDLSTVYPVIFDFVSGTISSLPVKILNFSALESNGVVRLTWSTADEKNFDYFTIERSSDLKTYTAIGTVKGNGNSSSILHYQFSDNAPLAGDGYYRLKATDFDGEIEYHQVLKVAAVKNESTKLSVYPNPVTGPHFKIQTSFKQGTIKIYSILGKEVFQGQIESGTEFTIGKRLNPGLYIVIAENGKEKMLTKLTIK